jgi:hypothetical protein
MPIRPTVELRDLDGTYVLVKPLDDVRGVVLNGTLHEQGQVLYKGASLSWKAASRDIGGATHLSPQDLVARETEEIDSPIPGVPDEDGDIFESAHHAIESRSRREALQEALTLEGPEEVAIENEVLRSIEQSAAAPRRVQKRNIRSA